MLERKDFLSLNFYKKEVFTGSCKGMRFRVARQDDELVVTIWPEPLSYACTPDDEKQSASFPFGEEGLCQVVSWLNEQYEVQKQRWKNAPFWVKNRSGQ